MRSAPAGLISCAEIARIVIRTAHAPKNDFGLSDAPSSITVCLSRRTRDLG